MNPLNLIPAPYRLIATIGLVVAFLASVYAFAYTKGFQRATANCEAAKFKAVQKYQAEYQKAVERANVLAQKLATRETEVVYRTKEVIKHVPKVTTGKSCLSADAVRMLNRRADDPAVSEAPGKSDAESPADPAADQGASDTDTAYWIADAIAQYEIAAARLNALIEYLEKGE